MNDISAIRKDYKLRSFNEADASENPFIQFDVWWADATSSNIDEVNAMTLATADVSGKPSARIVLLKGVKPDGFEFFTNYNSHKAKNIEENPNAAIVIFWKELERQIRIEGRVERTSEDVSNQYFISRPEGSKIGAWSSPQSAIIANRNELENFVTQTEQQFQNKVITRPEFWGGYILKPTLFEFWQGRSSRLHDRIEYILEDNVWIKRRLAP